MFLNSFSRYLQEVTQTPATDRGSPGSQRRIRGKHAPMMGYGFSILPLILIRMNCTLRHAQHRDPPKQWAGCLKRGFSSAARFGNIFWFNFSDRNDPWWRDVRAECSLTWGCKQNVSHCCVWNFGCSALFRNRRRIEAAQNDAETRVEQALHFSNTRWRKSYS